MAETPPAAPAKGGGKNFLTRKIGPQPMWAWMAEVLGLALAYSLYKQRKSAASTSSTSSTSSASGAVPADQVPDVIIQGPFTTGPTTGGTTSTAPAPPVQTPPTPPTATRPTSIVATGTDSGDLKNIAKSYGLTEAQLIAANPALKKLTVKVNGKTVGLYGSGQPVPKGTKVTIPPLPS